MFLNSSTGQEPVYQEKYYVNAGNEGTKKEKKKAGFGEPHNSVSAKGVSVFPAGNGHFLPLQPIVP